MVYIGQTSRKISTRIQEHFYRNKSFFIQDDQKEGAMLITIKDKNFNYRKAEKDFE